MNKTKLILLGGFLGAGKTTLMLAAADHLRSKGFQVACITNDQGQQLVDSQLVFSKDIPLQQIDGGCFCCKFNDLIDSIHHIISEQQPDLILAEAVGSCTDLVATVIKPLIRNYAEIIEICSFSVAVDPHRYIEQYVHDKPPFSKEINYLYQKQLEEAPTILLNKIDTLSSTDLRKVSDHIGLTFPFSTLIKTSATQGEGLEEWISSMPWASSPYNWPSLDIDYDRYADGEAQLGWLNGTFTLLGEINNFEELSLLLMEKVVRQCQLRQREVAHLKLWAQNGASFCKISLVRNADEQYKRESKIASASSSHLTITMNARVDIDHMSLKEIISHSLDLIEEQYQVKINIDHLEHFAPARPEPTYRIM